MLSAAFRDTLHRPTLTCAQLLALHGRILVDHARCRYRRSIWTSVTKLLWWTGNPASLREKRKTTCRIGKVGQRFALRCVSIVFSQGTYGEALKLLSGEHDFVPDLAVKWLALPRTESNVDTEAGQRFNYLRLVLAHIQAGGLRFKDHIVSSFSRQADLFEKVHQHLKEQYRMDLQSSDAPLLNVLSTLWRELHYTVEFREPLDVNSGDIGYIPSDPSGLQFVRLANVYEGISDGYPCASQIKKYSHTPGGRWKKKVVEGVTRYSIYYLQPHQP